MRFFYITDVPWDDRLAPTIHVDEICANLSRLGHDIKLYMPAHGGPSSARPYEIVALSTPLRGLSVWYQLRLFVRLCRDIRRERPDVLYSRHTDLLFIPVLLGKFHGIPVVLEVNGKLSDEATLHGTLIAKLLHAARIFKLIESFNVRGASGLIAVTPGIKDHLINRYRISPSKVGVITNGVDTDFFSPQPRDAACAKLGLPCDKTIVGYVGSFHSWQGLTHVIDAAKLVAVARPNVRFAIIGRGPEEDRLRAQIAAKGLSDIVMLRPAIAHAVVPIAMNAFDIGVNYPYASRGGVTSPFKIYEYLACGRPAVISDIKGMRDEFDGVVAYVPPESPRDLADTLISFIDDEGKRRHLGALGREWVERGCSWRAVAEQTVDTCSRFIRKHASERDR